MLKNLTIKSRLVLVISFLSIQLIVGGCIGVASLSIANTTIKTIYEDRLVCIGQLDRIIRLMNRSTADVEKALTGEQDEQEEAVKSVIQKNVLIDQEWREYMATYLTPEEQRLAEEFSAARKKYWEEGLKPAIEALAVFDTQAGIAAVHGPMDQLFPSVREKVDALIKLQLDVSKDEYTKSQKLYVWVRNSCVIGILFGLCLAALVGQWLVRAISKPLNIAVEVALAVANGNLSRHIEITSNDEAGQLMSALKDMNDGLGEIVSRVRGGAEVISTASSQIAAGTQDLSCRTEEQASSLEETAASLEQLTSTVKKNSNSAAQANQLAQSATETANKGGVVVSKVVDTMTSINSSSRKIYDIIGVIDSIAFQTNILALNAAVEAARAGEQGRGFAVVASEVRNLAQRSASAAREIKGLINSSAEMVDTGSLLVDQAGKTMQEVVDSIQSVATILSEITAASQEQTSGIEQIHRAVSEMDSVTQQNAALVEETAAAAEAMQSQAAILSHAVGIFILSDTAGKNIRLPTAVIT